MRPNETADNRKKSATHPTSKVVIGPPIKIRAHPEDEISEFELLMGRTMETEQGTESRISFRKMIAFATVASGLVAAYLMYRRGASLGTIAKQTITNPIGSLISEVKHGGSVAGPRSLS
jgi:hypothetical protein